MKTLDELAQLLEQFEKQYGFPVQNSRQGSDAWFKLKLGVISASNAHKVVAGKNTDTRKTYMAELVGQVCTGVMDEIDARALDWGKKHEDAARSAYEFLSGKKVTLLPFAFKDSTFRVGCSPDGIVDVRKGVEFKCPYKTVHYIRFLCDAREKPEIVWQNQFTMWVMGADEWDHCQYDPRVLTTPLKSRPATRDPEKQAMFNELVPAFIDDMDRMLARAGIKFGDQWKRLGGGQDNVPKAICG